MIFVQDPAEQEEADLTECLISMMLFKTLNSSTLTSLPPERELNARKIFIEEAVKAEEERFGPQARIKKGGQHEERSTV